VTAELVHSDITVTDEDWTPAFRESFRAAFRWMQLGRQVEERLAGLYRSGGRIVGGVYLGRGQEAFSAALGIQLQPGKDVFAPLIRDLPARLAFGEPLLDGFRTYLGTSTGPMRGRDGNVHRGRPREGLLAMISHLGSLLAVVNGTLFARRLKGTLGDAIGATSIGDGGTSTGAFHEALNQAAIERLPVIIGVANNQFAYSTPTDRQFACEDLVLRAPGYGVQGWRVDGTDLAACIKVFHLAADSARSGGGPQLVVGRMLRLSGHGEHDDASYVPDSARKSELGRDCLEVARGELLQRGIATQSDLDQWSRENSAEIDRAVTQAGREPLPDPFREKWDALSTTRLVEGYPA
jgi:TPP-dependent pyruvate/acetoin dehydrogenase alpha subunit